MSTPFQGHYLNNKSLCSERNCFISIKCDSLYFLFFPKFLSKMLTCPVAIGSFSSREVVVVVVAPTAKKTGMFVVSIRVLRKMS